MLHVIIKILKNVGYFQHHKHTAQVRNWQEKSEIIDEIHDFTDEIHDKS